MNTSDVVWLKDPSFGTWNLPVIVYFIRRILSYWNKTTVVIQQGVWQFLERHFVLNTRKTTVFYSLNLKDKLTRISPTTHDFNILCICKGSKGPSAVAAKTSLSSCIPLQGLVAASAAVADALSHGANLQECNRWLWTSTNIINHLTWKKFYHVPIKDERQWAWR
jgi:hypothetical protein